MKLVLFDLDGTLFRTETVDVEAFNRALAVRGFNKRSEKEILQLIGLTLDAICETLLGTRDSREIEKFRNDVIRFEDEAIASSGQLYEGVEEVLHRLKENGYTLCICSNGNKEYVTSIAEKFNLSSYFTEIWYEHPGITKVEAADRLRKKFGADRFVMVGDRLCDIDAAERNGGISIGVSYGFGGEEYQKARYAAHSIKEVEAVIATLFQPLR